MRRELTLLVLCCWLLAVKSEIKSFWHISDIHYDPTVKTQKRSCVTYLDDMPKYGSEFCDANLALLQSALENMKSIKSDPEFILWTGDSALHYLNGTVGTAKEIVDIMDKTSSELEKNFPTAQVIPTLGNHDFVPDNQLPAEMNDIYKSIADKWEEVGWMDNVENRSTFEHNGFYVTSVGNKLTVMAMNTNFYYPNNKLYENTETYSDPGEQFQMLESVLKNAKTEGKKVLITAHVPYGVVSHSKHMYDKYNVRFVGLVKQYHDVIFGSFFGHEHDDAFKLVKNDDGEVVSTAFLAPSITPWRYIDPKTKVRAPYHNPGITLIHYDDVTMKMVERQQFYFNLREANRDVNQPRWTLLYNFTDVYEVPDLSISSVKKAAESVRDGSKIHHYKQAYVCRPEVTEWECDETCEQGLICPIFYVYADEAQKCMESEIIPDDGNGAQFIALQAIILATVISLYFLIWN